jgi:hypothetical protein
MFKRGAGNWTQYRDGGIIEVDFHLSDDRVYERSPYWERMEEVRRVTLTALKEAYEEGARGVLFTHGWSTSRRGNKTARSVVRGIMRSKASTPYIVRKKCIQHESVFLAVIRPRSIDNQ